MQIDLNEIYEMHLSGMSNAAIGRQVGVSGQYIGRLLRERRFESISPLFETVSPRFETVSNMDPSPDLQVRIQTLEEYADSLSAQISSLEVDLEELQSRLDPYPELSLEEIIESFTTVSERVAEMESKLKSFEDRWTARLVTRDSRRDDHIISALRAGYQTVREIADAGIPERTVRDRLRVLCRSGRVKQKGTRPNRYQLASMD